MQRLENLLADSGIRLSSVVTDIVGVSGRAMIEVFLAHPDRLATVVITADAFGHSASRGLAQHLGDLGNRGE